jgi:hypothetical protein
MNSTRRESEGKKTSDLWIVSVSFCLYPFVQWVDDDDSEQKRVLKWVHMTPKENKFLVSQLVITFRLSLFLILLFPHSLPATLARKNLPTSDSDTMLVIMSTDVNVTSISENFDEFKKMFGIEFPSLSDTSKHTTFTSGRGELISFISSISLSLTHSLAPCLHNISLRTKWGGKEEEEGKTQSFIYGRENWEECALHRVNFFNSRPKIFVSVSPECF